MAAEGGSSSSSEEYVSADEGLDVFEGTSVARVSPSSTPSSPSPTSGHVTRTSQSPTGVSQRSDGGSPLTNKQDIDVVHHRDNTIEPHPPSSPTAEEKGHSETPQVEPPSHSPTSKTENTEERRSPVETVLEANEVQAHSAAGLNGDVASKSHDQTKSESGAVELHTGSGDTINDVCLGDTRITVVPEPEVSSIEGTTSEPSPTAVVEVRVVEKEEGGEKSQALKKSEVEGKESSEEKFPVPPPRRKRKNKKMNKQPSLENLREKSSSFSLADDDSAVLQRSMTVSSTDFKRERKKERQPSVKVATQQSTLHSPSTEDSKPSSSPDTGMTSPSVDSDSPKPAATPASPDLSSTPDHDRGEKVKSKPSGGGDGPLDRSLRSSRSATPTPAIFIEPDGSLELTADMINGIDNEVITSDTLQSAKARGSNNTGLGVIIPSDDESVDILLGEEEEEEEEEGERRTGVDEQDGDEGERGGATMVVGGVEEVLEGVSADSLPGSTPSRTRSVKKQGSEEERGHDHERTPQPTDPGEKTLELVDGQADGAQAADQGASPTDNAILESTMIKNLDTGEVMPLSAAEERIPRGHGWSPLSEHLLRRTNQMTADGHLPPLDEDEMDDSHQRGKIKKRLRRLTKWGKRKGRHGDSHLSMDDETMSLATDDQQHTVKYKNSSNKQGQLEFERVRLKQDLTGQHLGAVWSMEFSICGRLLATAGQDSVVRVWVLRTAYHFFHELQSQYQRLGVHSSVDSLSEKASMASNSSKSSEEDDANAMQPFLESPLCAYYGHTADILDISWSKNFFLLSSSMDKTVRLWHISRKECLCCFQHVDFVTAIAFHPRDDRYFLSGSLDGKLRLWNIPDKKVALWNEIEGVGSHLITAANFCMNGKLAVVGTYDGRCIFYETEHLKYHTQIHVRSRHGKNRGRKISAVEPLPGEDKLLVTSNDSRIRLYNLKDHSLSCKYKGCLNTSSQIKATFSRDGQYIISGSEDNYVYVWKTHIDMSKMPSRRDRNEFYESFSAHSAPVTTAVFAPVPGITVDQGLKEVGEMIVAADYQGCIKIYVSNENL